MEQEQAAKVKKYGMKCPHCRAAGRASTVDLVAIWMVEHNGRAHKKPMMYDTAYKAAGVITT